ncbi:phosphopyruvate hydratase, partial [Candidatus Parcubacteria bacterium]|nr:phosphopyruvate hydratase [Candidatus Parcubacteria bacterium]
MKIAKVEAHKILNSQGDWALAARVLLTNGASGTASVPSGISTGSWEAAVISTAKAVRNVNEVIAPSLVGESFKSQRTLDEKLIALDGTDRKFALGANSILSVSL